MPYFHDDRTTDQDRDNGETSNHPEGHLGGWAWCADK
jgi:hypothetical protein